MSMVENVEHLYSFFEDKDIEMVELHYDSEGFQLLSDFNEVVMEKEIDSFEIKKIVNFLKNKNDNISSHILDILLTNSSFFQNDLVKEEFYKEIEERIYEDIDSFDLHGDKLKIIDYFYNGKVEDIKKLIINLDDESKIDILMFIMEYSYHSDILDKTTPIGGLLSEYQQIVSVMYEQRDITDYGDDIEFEIEE